MRVKAKMVDQKRPRHAPHDFGPFHLARRVPGTRLALVLLLLTFVACDIAPASNALTVPLDLQTEFTLVGGEGEWARAKLALLVATQFYLPGPDGEITRTTLAVGALPALPIELPLPAESTIIGSIGSTGWNGNRVRLQSVQLPAVIVEFYDEALLAQGFIEIDAPRPALETPDTDWRAYCHEVDQQRVDVSAWREEAPNLPASTGDTAVQLHVAADARYVECSAEPPVQMASYAPSQIPTLTHPAEVSKRGSGGSYRGEGHVDIEIISSQSANELAVSYSKQLVDAGWTRLDATTSDYAATSAWRFRDEAGLPWTGVLTVTAQPESPRRYVDVRVTRVAE